MSFNRFTTNVENIQKLEDRPQIPAQDLKACFDQAGVDLKNAINGIMDQLEALSSAGNLGANALGDNFLSENVQGILEELKIVTDYLNQEVIKTQNLFNNSDNMTANAGEGYPTENLTARLNRIKVAMDELVIGQIPKDSISNRQLGIDIKVGSLAELSTQNKNDIVSALNELKQVCDEYFEMLNEQKVNKAEIAPKPFNIETIAWVQNEATQLYEATIEDDSITENDLADVVVDSETYSIAEEAGIKGYAVEESGAIRLFAESVPSGLVSGKYCVNRGVANGEN